MDSHAKKHEFLGCAWQTQPTKMEFKGTGDDGGGEQVGMGTVDSKEERDDIFAAVISRYKTFKFVPSRLQRDGSVCDVH